MNIVEHTKCNGCHGLKPNSDFLNATGRVLKCCIRCRTRQKKYEHVKKCEHNKQRNLCRECGGSSICEHNKQRNYCRECGGSSFCEHNKQRAQCRACNGSSFCEHNKRRNICRACGGALICEHNKRRNLCKRCKDPIKVTIKNWIKSSKQADKKHNRFDIVNYIDYSFCKLLTEEYTNCYYDDCKVELQYIEYNDTLATIERLDNAIGHIKSNCVLCCMRCNKMVKSNRTE